MTSQQIAEERNLTIDHYTGIYLDEQGNEYRGEDGEVIVAEGSIFKCRGCGEPYHDSFCATDDISLCRWCSGEET